MIDSGIHFESSVKKYKEYLATFPLHLSLNLTWMFVCRVSLFDYQAMCKNSHHHASSARPLLSVSLKTHMDRVKESAILTAETECFLIKTVLI